MESTVARNSPGRGRDPDPAADETNLTWIQRLLWAGQELHPDVPLYNMALAFELRGSLDPGRFGRAVRSVIDRADILRTVFVRVDGDPDRRLTESGEWSLPTVDLSSSPDPEAAARAWMEGRVERVLDPAEPLLDMALLRLGPERHVWYVNQHHLITDGWSVALLYEEVAKAYGLSGNGRLEAAADLPSYDEHLDFERSLRGSRAHTKAVQHWREQLEAAEPLPLYGKRGRRARTESERRTVPLGADRSAALRALARRPEARGLTEHLSLFNATAACLFAFLHRVSGAQRLALATPAHNRRNERAKATLGPFIEVFPLVVEVAWGETFADLLERTARAAAGFVRHALPGASLPQVTRSCNVVLNYIQARFPAFDGLHMRSEWLHPGHSDLAHDVRVQVHDFDDAGEFVLHFDLSTERFGADERDALISHFLHLLDAFTADPDQPLLGPALADAEERARLLEGWRSPEAAPEGTVVERFRGQVAAGPDEPAIRHGAVTWSYRELADRVGRVGRALGQRGVAGGNVAVAATRHPETVATLLGILEAGAAYVPLDPTHPPHRLRVILEETGAPLLLAREEDADMLSELPVEIVRVGGWLEGDDGGGRGRIGPDRASSYAEAASAAGAGPPDAAAPPRPDDPAYILYTSGSTGRPKGVVITHRSLLAYSEWAARTYWHGERLAAPLFTPLTFDLTVTSIFPPLLAGGSIVAYPLGQGGIDTALLHLLDEDRVDIVKLTPAHLALLRGRDLSDSRVRTLVLGGAELRPDVALAAWRAFGEGVTIYNEYGPTEATVGCMVHRFDPDAETGASVPIGRAAGAARICLVDTELRPVPPGIAGEILVGGPGVAAGYVSRPAEMARRFVDDLARPGRKAYRTGDLGRQRADGTIEFLGRMDRQVKLHGIRIEPGEIEAALTALPGVEGCAVQLVETAIGEDPESHCARCGLPSNYPDLRFDDSGVCSVCRTFERYERRALDYFGSMDRLREIFNGRPGAGEFDCIVLYSGGKDSTYALYRLADMGLRILALTLDNGFISDEAKANIRRVVDSLGIAHEYLSTPAMNEVFVDSLRRHSNVCNGCFKVMYTLATNVAVERDIPFVVTGLSRGQFFETRLTEELFLDDRYAPDDIDELVLEARRAYHRVDDAVRRCLDTSAFEDDDVFERVQFVDFYRYCDVELEKVYAFLAERAPWVRPADTGRSTNCLINDVGIHVHKLERGFHNYAWPYSWDVRLGHKERRAALDELDDDIDERRVEKILDRIGYTPLEAVGGGGRLVAYVVTDGELEAAKLRSALGELLPSYMIPADFIPLDRLPLTEHGKVDTAALPSPAASRSVAAPYAAPRDEGESWLADAWARALRIERVGIHDNFFDLGGDSIAVIQITAQATQAGFAVEPNMLFRFPTIAELADRMRDRTATPSVATGSAGSDLSGAVDDEARARVLEQLERAEQRAARAASPGSSDATARRGGPPSGSSGPPSGSSRRA